MIEILLNISLIYNIPYQALACYKYSLKNQKDIK